MRADGRRSADSNRCAYARSGRTRHSTSPLARQFREEHRAALDWLNSRTDAETRFFGVEIATVRIGDSAPAPLFRLIAGPNGWGKNVKTRTQAQGQEGEMSLHYTEFWQRYIPAAQGANLTGPRKAPQYNWFDTSSGIPNARYVVSFTKRGLLSEIYFRHPDPAINTTRFEQLLAVRPELEAAYGGPLLFEPLDDRKGCRIGEILPGSILDQDEWPTHLDWFVDTQRRLRAAITAVGGVQAGTRAP